MMIAGLTRRAERLVSARVKTGGARAIIRAIADRAATRNVQTKFETARSKTLTPIEGPLRPKIVPLQRDTETVEVAPKLAPPPRYCAPRSGFVIANHRAKFTGGADANASEVSPQSTR